MGQVSTLTIPSTAPEAKVTNPSRSLGYLISPHISPNLSPHSRVADLATGTSAWLLDLAASPHAGPHQLHGFDISPAQFPPAHTLPRNLTLHVADVKAPLSASFHGRFDLVHARLLMCAVDPHEWPAIVANAAALLRPGGHLQWEEADFHTSYAFPMRQHAGSRVGALRRGLGYLRDAVEPRARDCTAHVERAFGEAGLRDVETDVVATDRLEGMRARTTGLQIGAFEGVARRRVESGVPGAWPVEEVERTGREMRGDAATGGYTAYHIVCVTGRKPGV